MEAITERIKELINKEQLTNTEFAKKININPSIVSHILSGRNKPSLQVIELIRSSFTNVNLDYLITGNGELYTDVTNVKSVNPSADLPEMPVTPAAGLPMEGVRFAAIPGSVPAYGEPSPVAGEPREESPEQYGSSSTSGTGKESAPPPPDVPAGREIEQIVIFYQDGSFKAYRP